MNKPLIGIKNLIGDVPCYEAIRHLRWPEGVSGSDGGSPAVINRGIDETHPARQKYGCKACDRRFDDLTNTVFAAHPQPLRVWKRCLYFMGLNLSNQQIAKELDLNKDDVQARIEWLRNSGVKKNLTSL